MPSTPGNGSLSVQAGGGLRKGAPLRANGPAGVVAPLVGKKPPDTNTWVLPGAAPAFLKSEGPIFDDGPIWRVELAKPVGPEPSSAASSPSH